MIDLVLLGCGGNMPMPNRFLSSLFINYKGRKILIDCGEGTQVSMRMKNCGFKNIDFHITSVGAHSDDSEWAKVAFSSFFPIPLNFH